MFLRQSTASQEVLLGSFLDDTDGKTAETGLTIANTDIKVWKSGGTTEASKNSGGATHIASGRYYAVLDATDTDTVGLLEINVHVSGALPVRRQFYVLEEAVYDALFAASAAGYQVPIWAAANSTVALTNTTIASTQKVDVETIKTQAVTCAAGVTVPSSIASPTNITAASGVTISGTLTTIDAVWTELKRWLRILVRADSSIAADYSDVLTSINANTGTGTGVYDNTASALHALHTHLADIENGTNDPLVSTSGTATAGGASTITLAVGTAGGTDYYVRQAVMLTGGTGAGQTNRITAYNSGTRVATVADAWVTQPDNTTTYKVLGRTE